LEKRTNPTRGENQRPADHTSRFHGTGEKILAKEEQKKNNLGKRERIAKKKKNGKRERELGGKRGKTPRLHRREGERFSMGKKEVDRIQKARPPT